MVRIHWEKEDRIELEKSFSANPHPDYAEKQMIADKLRVPIAKIKEVPHEHEHEHEHEHLNMNMNMNMNKCHFAHVCQYEHEHLYENIMFIILEKHEQNGHMNKPMFMSIKSI